MFRDKTFSKTLSLSILSLYFFFIFVFGCFNGKYFNCKIFIKKYIVSKWESQRLFTLLKLHAVLNLSYIYFLQRVKYKHQFCHMNKFQQDIRKLLKNVDYQISSIFCLVCVISGDKGMPLLVATINPLHEEIDRHLIFVQTLHLSISKMSDVLFRSMEKQIQQ